MVVLRDQAFPVDGGTLGFDLIRPDGPGPYPLVVFLHGGGWISGDKTMYRDEAVWLAPQGFACACVEYRLAPLYPFPTPVADCQAFVRFARQNGDALGIDGSRITAVGNSAGGHLALMLGLCPVSFGADSGTFERIEGAVGICGIADLIDPARPNFPVAMSFLEQFMDGAFDGREDLWKAASPVNYLDRAQGRYLLLHGLEDDVVPVEQSRRLARGLQEAGTAVKLVELEGEAHSFTYAGWERIRQEYSSFLKQTVTAPS